jgi:dihydrolipoamide dehydrogenase
VLLAVGRIPYTDGLGLKGVGVELEGRAIAVDDYLETNIRGIYAIGDVNGGPILAHRASWEGERVAENVLGERRPVDPHSVPYCIYSLPEMAGVGLTEEEVQGRNIPFVKTRFPFSANPRAQVLGQAEGLVKMLCHRETKDLLGLHIFGPRATELIPEGALALEMGADAGDIAAVMHAHPTLTEAIREAALAQLDGAIHSL